MSEADDRHYLAAKVITVFGIYGATRGEELTKVEMEHVREQGSVFVIKIPQTKTKIVRTFTVEDEANYIREYAKLRPLNVRTIVSFSTFKTASAPNNPLAVISS